MNDEIKCPKCGSAQISANKKGFSGAKALGGAIIAGPLGLAAGTIGSNKLKITCLACGHVFSPGQKIVIPENKPGDLSPNTALIAIVIMAIALLAIIVKIIVA